jgi:hypothetical protein
MTFVAILGIDKARQRRDTLRQRLDNRALDISQRVRRGLSPPFWRVPLAPENIRDTLDGRASLYPARRDSQVIDTCGVQAGTCVSVELQESLV